MKPIRYLIHVEPNLEQFSFKGFTTIWIESAEPTKEIILNAKELNITEVKAGLDPNNQEAYNNRGWSKKFLGDTKGACADWKKSKKLGNKEAKIIYKNNHCK